jgi:putative restriction endonuclease
VPEAGKLAKGRGNADPLKSEFIKFQVMGGFSAPVYEAFRRNPLLVRQAAKEILKAHFPASVHSEILDGVGLDMELPSDRVRHPSFRSEVLDAYGHACAFCGYSVRLGNADLGLDGAHIMWYQAGGPDISSNGLAFGAHENLPTCALQKLPTLRTGLRTRSNHRSSSAP